MRFYTAIVVTLLILSGCGEKSGETQNTSTEVASENPGTDQPRAFCQELQRMVTDEDCTLAKDLVARAETGVAAFNAPSPMTRGKAQTIQLVLAFAPPAPPPVADPAAKTLSTAADAMEKAGDSATSSTPTAAPLPDKPQHPPTPAEIVDPLPGPTVEFTPVVGRHMAAELTGDGFDIIAKSPRSQDVLPDSRTSWEWSVKPVRKGPLTLTLKTFVEAEFAGGKRYTLRSLTTNQTIDVAVTPLDRVADFLDALPGWLKRVTLVLAGVTALLTAWFGLRKLFAKPQSK